MDLTIFIQGHGAECFYHCFPPKTKEEKAVLWFRENWIEDRSTTLFFWKYDDKFQILARETRTHIMKGHSKVLRKVDEKPLDRTALMVETDFASWSSLYSQECQSRQEFWIQLTHYQCSGWYLWKNIKKFDVSALSLQLLRYRQVRYDVDNNVGELINDFYSVLDTMTYEGRRPDEYAWACDPLNTSTECMRLLID